MQFIGSLDDACEQKNNETYREKLENWIDTHKDIKLPIPVFVDPPTSNRIPVSPSLGSSPYIDQVGHTISVPAITTDTYTPYIPVTHSGISTNYTNVPNHYVLAYNGTSTQWVDPNIIAKETSQLSGNNLSSDLGLSNSSNYISTPIDDMPNDNYYMTYSSSDTSANTTKLQNENNDDSITNNYSNFLNKIS
jgi:hypothetical protein